MIHREETKAQRGRVIFLVTLRLKPALPASTVGLLLRKLESRARALSACADFAVILASLAASTDDA